MGTTVMVGAVSLDTDEIVDHSMNVVAGANIHQLATALEMFYMDHDRYPTVSGGEALVRVLERGRYIRNAPLDPTLFIYEPVNSAQDYNLELDPDCECKVHDGEVLPEETSETFDASEISEDI
jgi:hypothetical protein